MCDIDPYFNDEFPFFPYFNLFIICNWLQFVVKYILKYAYKHIISTGIQIFYFNHIYIALELTVSSFISVTMKWNNSIKDTFYYHGHLISVNI